MKAKSNQFYNKNKLSWGLKIALLNLQLIKIQLSIYENSSLLRCKDEERNAFHVVPLKSCQKQSLEWNR